MANTIIGQQLTRRSWIAGGVAAVATPAFLTACGGGGELESGTELAQAEGEERLTAQGAGVGSAGFTSNHNYGKEVNGGDAISRQVLDLYRGNILANTLSPVYIWAHPNQTTYRLNLPSDSLRGQLHSKGISVISWESHQSLNTGNQDDVMADAELMMRWVRERGPSLGLDPNRIVLGGSSRGTYASWLIGHAPAVAGSIKGMFMKQALPGSLSCTNYGREPNEIDDQTAAYWVTPQSPYIKFIHQPSISDNFHSSHNSQPVMEAYIAKGIGSRASMVTNATSVGAMDSYCLSFVTGCLGIPGAALPVANNPGAEGVCPASGGGGGGGGGFPWPWPRK